MLKALFILLMIIFSTYNYAKEIDISISNHLGVGVGNIVVYLEPTTDMRVDPIDNAAIMDQIDTQFSPHILVVQKNTLVTFPNSDSIKHHVYSFSPAKTFELQLYKNLQADPLLFSEKGVVELGCNVHDWMLGYIFIVDTPYFTKSNKNGSAKLDVPFGEYRLKVWSPLIQENIDTLFTNIKVSSDTVEQKIILKKELLPNLLQYESSDEFQDYD